MGFVSFSEQTAIISVNSINKVNLVMEKCYGVQFSRCFLFVTQQLQK
jgi:hypothetical protein